MRGERENEFEQGGARKSQLWVDICRIMRDMGYDFTPEKVSKKWHNIMITYNKNIGKKVQSGNVNWEFFEDIDRYFKEKRLQSYDDTSSYKYEDIPSPETVAPLHHIDPPIHSNKRKLSVPAQPSAAQTTFFKIEK